jgi:hypothetical protein
MLGHQAGCRRCRSRTPRVTDALILGIDMGKNPFQVRIDERPGAHVLRLFLAPDHFRIAEAAEFVDQRLGRERIELLDTQEIDIVNAPLLALFQKVVIDLAGAHHDATDLVVLL